MRMTHRLSGRLLLFSAALVLAACGGGGGGSVTPGGGGGGGGGGPTPTPPPVGLPTSSTQTFTASTSGPTTVTFGAITGGITAKILIPTAAAAGSATATLTAGPPSGAPAVSNSARRPKNIGGTIVPLAYFTITANSALSFAQSPAVILTTPTSTTYAYVAAYDTTNGWIAVAGPGTLVGGQYVINPTDESYSVAAGQTGVFAIFGSSTLISVNPPTSPVSDSCGLAYRRAVNGHRLAPRAVSHVVPNRLYVSYRAGSSAQSLARSVGAIRSVDLTPTKGVSHAVVTLATGTNRDQAAATLRAQSGVVVVALVHTRSVLSDGAANDPLLNNDDQWYLYRTSTDPGGWALTHGTGVTIAVIDTGVDLTNADLSPKLTKGESIVGGMVTPSAQDTNGHGTNTAGLAVAATNNGYGYAGVGWDVHLLDYKIFADANAFSDCQGADTADEAQAIDDAVTSGAAVISLSLGSPNDIGTGPGSGADQAEQDAVEGAITANVTVVAAAGNEYDGQGNGLLLDYPAAYPGVIAVGASAVFDSTPNSYSSITSETVASYSNSGPTLLAPGGDSLSDPANDCTGGNNPCDVLHWIEGYSTTSAGLPADRCSNTNGVCSVLFNGTSQATPQVAGAVALMTAYHNSRLTPAQVKTILSQNSDALPGLGSDRQGAGRLNVAKAVAAAHP